MLVAAGLRLPRQRRSITRAARRDMAFALLHRIAILVRRPRISVLIIP
jgi:hypothetical protein